MRKNIVAERLRIRHLPVTGRWAVERRKTEYVFGFLPVYIWVLIIFHDTPRAAHDAVENGWTA